MEAHKATSAHLADLNPEPFQDPFDFYVHFDEVVPVDFEFTLAQYHWGSIPKMYVLKDFNFLSNCIWHEYEAGDPFNIYDHGFDVFRHMYREGYITKERPRNHNWNRLTKKLKKAFKWKM